ncbi:MAG: preprotein translocase subunit SecG [Planctomycetota bacterium]|nr:MAG: preprotein translocase subunit SecG [Planctomycetota bacterium]
MVLPVAAVPLIMRIVGVIWILVALGLILIILLQKGKGGGLGAAFGGGAGSLLGTKTTDFFTKVTIVLVLLFLLLAVIMVKWYKPGSSEDLSQPLMPTAGQQMPLATPQPDQATQE